MLELFHFLVDYQLWIYAILGILAVIYLVRLISAWRERHATIFGLEREDAQRRLNIQERFLFIHSESPVLRVSVIST